MEVDQLPRFGPLRAAPPHEVIASLTGARTGTAWIASKMGDENGYPNGGLWRVEADRRDGDGPAAVIVKRTGPAYLGTFRVWRLRPDPTDPQWWGREANFYSSELATAGWTDDVRAAACFVDDHDGCRDLWIEELSGIPASLDVCRRAAAGLAHWQVANLNVDRPDLPRDWISRHIARHGLNNEQTLAHPAWSSAIERGLNPHLRDLVRARITDPAEIDNLLSGFPQMLTNYDFHNGNIGTAGDQVALIDWAYLGWGPVGHDVGHLAMTLEPQGTISASDAWPVLQNAYCEALAASGWAGDLGSVQRSMVLSNQIRLGWQIDTLLALVDKATDEQIRGESQRLTFLATLAS